MTEALSLLLGIFVGAWLMYRKQSYKAPVPFIPFGDEVEVEDPDDMPLNKGKRL